MTERADRVDLAVGRALAALRRLGQRRDRGGLRCRHQLVQLTVTRRRVAHEQRPRHVRAVPGDLGAEVEQQHLARRDLPRSRRAVGQRRVGAREARDVECQRLRAVGPHLPLELEGQLVLADAAADRRQQPLQRSVGDGSGGGDPFDFGRLLDLPVPLDPALDRHELDRGGGIRELRPQRLADEPGLHNDSHRSTVGRRTRDHALGQLRPARDEVVVDLLDPRVRALGPGLRRVARIGEHDDLVAAHQEPPRVACDLLLAVAELEAGQVAGVLAPDAEVGIDAGLIHAGAEPLEPDGPGRTVGGVPAL